MPTGSDMSHVMTLSFAEGVAIARAPRLTPKGGGDDDAKAMAGSGDETGSDVEDGATHHRKRLTSADCRRLTNQNATKLKKNT